MNHEPIDDAEFLHNAHLTGIDHAQHLLVFSVLSHSYRVPVSDTAGWHVGDVGRLRLPTPERAFAFHAYEDPALRRTPDLDDPTRALWGWRLGSRRIFVAAGVLPGVDDAVIASDAEPFQPVSAVQSPIYAVSLTLPHALGKTGPGATASTSARWPDVTSIVPTGGTLVKEGPDSDDLRSVLLQMVKTVTELRCLRTILAAANLLTVFNKDERAAAFDFVRDIERAIAAAGHPRRTRPFQSAESLTITVDLDAVTAAAIKRFAEKCTYEQAHDVLYPHIHENLRSEQAYTILRGMEAVNRALADAGVRSWPWVDCGYPA